MQENFFNLIKNIKLQEISPQFKKSSLVDYEIDGVNKAISKPIIKPDKISFVLDIGILEINELIAGKLINKIKLEFAKITDKNIHIILTSSSPKPQLNDSKLLFNKQEIPIKESKVKGVRNIIAVASGKGGVGKSTVAVNLAISLKRIGYKIGLVDADIYGPSIAYLMNLKGKPKSEGNLMLPINSFGIDCISVGSLVEATKATVWRGPMVTKALTQLISGTKWQDIDYLIIDLPPGTGDVHLSLIQQFKPDGAIMISTPQNLAAIDVIKAADMLYSLNVPLLGMIQNMAFLENNQGEKSYIFGKDAGKKLAEDMNIKFLGNIAIDPIINQSNDDRKPICEMFPSHKISLEFGRIAEEILDKLKVIE